MKGNNKNKRKGRYSKPSNRQANDCNSPRDERKWSEESSDSRKDARNDISWYTKYPNLLQAAGSFPYPYRPGMSLNIGQYTIPTVSNPIQRQFVIPGVMVLDWVPSVGYSKTATDPASIMAKEIYAKVRAAFSGSLDADGPDFVVYLGALDSIFTYLAWLKRLYRVMNAWTPENYVLPDVVLSAMGFTAANILSLRQHRTQLWQCINELILMSRKFTCPAVMDLFNRHYWMSDNVYTDSPDINSQFYLFNPTALYKYAALDMPDGNPGPGLQMTLMPQFNSSNASNISVELFYQFGRSLIDALVAWDDAYTINGYLQRAYAGVPTFIVEELPQDAVLLPQYTEEVLTQIENSRAIPFGRYWDFSDLSGLNVTQDVPSNAVISDPTVTLDMLQAVADSFQRCVTTSPTLSARSPSPTVADSVIASRLQCAVKSYTMSGNSATLKITAATEIPVAWHIYKTVRASNVWGTGGIPYPQVVNFTYQTGAGSTTTAGEMIAMLEEALGVFEAEQFDWHPFSFVTRSSYYNATPNAGCFVAGDTHNITSITVTDLENLHKICVYSELNAFSV